MTDAATESLTWLGRQPRRGVRGRGVGPDLRPLAGGHLAGLLHLLHLLRRARSRRGLDFLCTFGGGQRRLLHKVGTLQVGGVECYFPRTEHPVVCCTWRFLLLRSSTSVCLSEHISTKFEGKTPTLPAARPFHQPSSTSPRNSSTWSACSSSSSSCTGCKCPSSLHDYTWTALLTW